MWAYLNGSLPSSTCGGPSAVQRLPQRRRSWRRFHSHRRCAPSGLCTRLIAHLVATLLWELSQGDCISMCLLVPPLISLSSHTPSLPHSLTATNLSCSEPIYIAYYNHAGDRSGHANFKSLPPLSFWKRFDSTSHFGCHCHVSSY